MKQIDHLLDHIETQLDYRVRMGQSWRIHILVAMQNEQAVNDRIARLFHKWLKGTDWDTQGLSETEIAIKREHFTKDVFSHFRILVDVHVKPYPAITGNFIEANVSKYDHIYYDLDVCEGYLRFMERQG